jgi:short-subunit dehydrogenase involved in D-alanine esterification of teichoic acids
MRLKAVQVEDLRPGDRLIVLGQTLTVEYVGSNGGLMEIFTREKESPIIRVGSGLAYIEER